MKFCDTILAIAFPLIIFFYFHLDYLKPIFIENKSF